MDKQTISFVGAGKWGNALASCISPERYAVLMWGRRIDSFRTSLPHIPKTMSLQDISCHSDRWIVAVPAQSVRQVFEELVQRNLPAPKMIVLACKGIEASSGSLISEVVTSFFPDAECLMIAGPNLAQEVLEDCPSGLTVAGNNAVSRKEVMAWFEGSCLILDHHGFLECLEIQSALKNVIAIGYGLLSQVAPYKNTRATFLTLGLRDITNFSQMILAKKNKLPPQMDPLLYFGSIGDFWLTCTSSESRNSSFGAHFPNPVPHTSPHSAVVEGLPTLSAACTLITSHPDVCSRQDFPILEGMRRILFENLDKALWLQALVPFNQP